MKQHIRTAIRLAAAVAFLFFAVATVPEAYGQSGRGRSSERGETTGRSSPQKSSSGRTASRPAPKETAKPSSARKATPQKATEPTTRASSTRPASSGRQTARGSGRQETAQKAPSVPSNRSGSATRSGTDNRTGSATRSGTDNRAGSATRSGSDSRAGSATRSGSRVATPVAGGRSDSGVRESDRRGTATADRTRTASPAVRNTGNRSVYRPPANRPTWRNHYGRSHRAEYGFCTTHHHPGHYHYAKSRIHISSHVYIGVRWPWTIRYRAHWAPRYRYRQVVYVDAGWGDRRHAQQVDVRTTYRQRVLDANDQFARIEIDIESVEIYQGGRYVGLVDRIPSSLSRVLATVHADGYIEFDRNVFLIGDDYRGFEMLSTQHYDDYLLNAWERGHQLRAGRVDLRRGRVTGIGYSRLFNPYAFDGLVPISLLPDDDRLWDYGRDAISDGYGYGVDEQYGDDWRYNLDRSDEITYNTSAGISVGYTRETRLERIN